MSLAAVVGNKERIHVNHLRKRLAETGARDSGQEDFLEEGALELEDWAGFKEGKGVVGQWFLSCYPPWACLILPCPHPYPYYPIWAGAKPLPLPESNWGKFINVKIFNSSRETLVGNWGGKKGTHKENANT